MNLEEIFTVYILPILLVIFGLWHIIDCRNKYDAILNQDVQVKDNVSFRYGIIFILLAGLITLKNMDIV
jgi:hypothetical protein